MSRLRSIKPDFWSSEQVLSLSRDARLLFIGMWNFADDEGRIKLSPTTLKAQVFPGDDDATKSRMVEWLSEIVRRKLLEPYTNDQELFGYVTGWKKHQRIDKPQAPKHPGPQDIGSTRLSFQEYSANVLGTLATEREIGEKGIERGERETRVRAAPLAPLPDADNSQAEPPIGARPAAVEPEPGEPARDAFTEHEQRITFQREFERVARTGANMGGKQVGQFHATVLRTAELQGKKPRELFKTALATWLKRGFDDRSRSHPYACFCADWGDLTSEGPTRGSDRKESVESLREQAREATIAGQMDKVRSLTARIKELQDAEQQQAGGRRARA